jgi:hypothetical protein
MLLLLLSSLQIVCLVPLVLKLSKLFMLLQAFLKLYPLLEVLQLLQHRWSSSLSADLQTWLRVELRSSLVSWWLVFWHCETVSTP